MNNFQQKLISAFEATVPSDGTTLIMFSHPRAPSLLMSRNPESLPQVVPVLLAGTNAGDEESNTQLGVELSLAGHDWLPLFQGITDGAGFRAVMSPMLFYRPAGKGTFPAAARTACRTLEQRGLLAGWCMVRCGIRYLTKDGRFHAAEEYPAAIAANTVEEAP